MHRSVFSLALVAMAVGCGSGLPVAVTSPSGGSSGLATSAAGTTAAGATTTASGGSGAGGQTSGGTAAGGSTTGSAKLPPGADCSSDSACASGACGVGGTGRCCTTPCSTESAICGATQCDAAGTCMYGAAGIACDSSCAGGQLNHSLCDGSGGCSGTPTACPGNYACQDLTSCKTTCTGDGDCATGFYCAAGSCLAQAAAGPCTANDMCTSGICGLNGSGNCCSTTCVVGDPNCGASGCDVGTAACSYPAATTACGAAVPTCSSDNTTSNLPSLCDGKGACPNSQIACAPYACSGGACLKSCAKNLDCQTFCDSARSACCDSSLGQGDGMLVDGIAGNDQATCCGVGSNAPCQTIARSLEVIDEAQAENVNLTATLDGSYGVWPTSTETYPVTLGWGTELIAPNITFTGENAAAEIFDIAAVSALDTTASASIVGGDFQEVIIGYGAETGGIRVESGNTLYLAGTSVNESPVNAGTAITVAAGGTLVLGQDQSANNSGTVYVGYPGGGESGWNGIVCESANGKGCTIRDVDIAETALNLAEQENYGLYATDFASISLTSSPVFGDPPQGAGFAKCVQKIDQSWYASDYGAIYLVGRVDLTLGNATLQCLNQGGVYAADYLDGTGNGEPAVTITNSTIQNTEFGIYCNAGTVDVANSLVQYNYYGVWQDNGVGQINLDGSDAGGSNTVICNSNAETHNGTPSTTDPQGVSVFNSSTRTLDADDVVWDTTAPDFYSCSWSGGTFEFTSCSCKSASCSVAAGGDGMDAVYSGSGALSTKNPTQSKVVCFPKGG